MKVSRRTEIVEAPVPQGTRRENTGRIGPVVDNAQRRLWRDASAVECNGTFTTGS